MTSDVKRREIFGWAMYDFANSSYTTVIITAVYASFFTEFIVPQTSKLRDTYWSLAIILSTLLSLALSPLVGAICDLSGRKKKYLFATTLACSLLTMSLSFAGPGEVLLAIFIVTFSNAAFMVSETLCGSFLTELANKENMGKISGIGWAIGYFGGLACLALVQLVIKARSSEDFAAFVTQNQLATVLTGLFFLVASLPTFLFVKERSEPAPGFERATVGEYFSAGLVKFKHSWQLLKQNPLLLRFFKAFAVYMAGIHVVVSFVGIYARGELNFETPDLVKMFLVLQISAAAGAFAFGYIENKIGPKKTVLLSLAWWVAGVLAIFFLADLAQIFSSSPKNVFFVIALIAGAALGATQSSSRTIVGLLVSKEHSSQIFGLWGSSVRVASLLGMSFGFVSDALSSRRLALLLVLAFFVIGGALFSRLPLNKGFHLENNS